MKSVVIITDVFRGKEFGLHSVAQNARWLRGLLHGVLSTTGFSQSLFTSECDDGRFEVARYRSPHDLPKNGSGWAKLVNTKIETEVESYSTELLNAELVIA